MYVIMSNVSDVTGAICSRTSILYRGLNTTSIGCVSIDRSKLPFITGYSLLFSPLVQEGPQVVFVINYIEFKIGLNYFFPSNYFAVTDSD